MIKNLSIKVLVLSVVLMMSLTDLNAQTRVRFRRGSNSTTISGTLAAGVTRGYVLGARSGQILSATVSSSNGKVDFTQGAYHDSQYSMTIERNGDAYISIDNHGGRATRYTLTISIQ
ncbi:MAG: hypothetical protein ABIP06_11680 [Pyrinomonadaceae bacterium]